MLSLIPLLWRKLEPASFPCIAVCFWSLAVLVHVKLQGDTVEPFVLGAMFMCCLLLLGFVDLRWWKSLGTPGLLLLASIASYLLISVVVSLAGDSESVTEDVMRQGFFFFVTLAAILGGRWLLELIGVEALLKWALVVLLASCVVILATPLLREIGALPEYRLPYRLTGAFTDPNDAGFIACMTAGLALAFQANGRRSRLGYLALVLGCAAGLASFSNTAIIVLGVMLILFLLLHVRRLRQAVLHTGLTVLCLVAVLGWLFASFQGITAFEEPDPPASPVVETGEAVVLNAEETKRVGSPVIVYLAKDGHHRADDDPPRRWQWQRADAVQPDDATWADIPPGYDISAGSGDGTHRNTFRYTPTEEDVGKFLRAHVSYEKYGVIHQVHTMAVGPVLGTPASEMGQIAWTVTDIRGEYETFNTGGLWRRIGLWELGAEKVLDSPIVGHGLYQFHYMEGAPIGNQGVQTGVHNLYLMLIGEAGILPLALYLLALFFMVRLLWTVPKSLGRDLVVVWVIVMALFGLAFHHLLTMGAYNFVMGLACAIAAFLVQGQRDQAAAGGQEGNNQGTRGLAGDE